MVEYVFLTKNHYTWSCLISNVYKSVWTFNSYLVTMFAILLYRQCRSWSQINDDLETFIKAFKLSLDEINKKTLTVALDNFNTESQTWCESGITLFAGSKFDILTCNHGLYLLIN